MSLKVETCVAQHIGDRTEQQDCVAMFPHGVAKGTLVAVLADGMGGHSGGRLAAEQVIHAARQRTTLDHLPPVADTPEFLRSIIVQAHNAITLTRFTSEQDPHSTACLLVMRPERADWAYCGDSRIYHFRHANLVTRTRDHSLVNKLVQEGFISEEDALTHPKRNILLRCLGEEKIPEVDFGSTESLADGDTFLLCSDGLWGDYRDAEIGQMLNADHPRVAAEKLIAEARARTHGRGDNISLAIVKMSEIVEDKRPAWRR